MACPNCVPQLWQCHESYYGICKELAASIVLEPNCSSDSTAINQMYALLIGVTYILFHI